MITGTESKSPAESRRAFALCFVILIVLLGLLADVSQDAAVGVEDLTIDEVGSMGGQEDAGAHHVLRVAPAACGGLGTDERVERVAAAIGLDLAQGSGLGGGNVAGAPIFFISFKGK